MKGLKKIIAIILCTILAFTAIPMASFAAENRTVVDSGFCGAQGENLAWTLYDDGELVISGEGEMDWYEVENSSYKLPPWFDRYDDIDIVTLEEGVTSIGHHAFSTGLSRKGGFEPTSYYKMNLPKSLEFVENDIFSDIGENRIPGQHLAYVYAGSQQEWNNVLKKVCNVVFDKNNKPIDLDYLTGSVYGIMPANRFEKLYFNGEEPEAFCELIMPYSADIDIVTHYYASNPEAAKIEWYMVNEGKEIKVGETPAGVKEPVEIKTPEFEKGDVYFNAKITDADGNVIVSSENLLIGNASVKEPSFFDRIKMYFQALSFEFYLLFYILDTVIKEGLISELFESWFDSLIWWN